MFFLGILGWVVIGFIVGFAASKAVNLRGDDPRLGIGVAVGGSIVAASLYCFISGNSIADWNPWSLLFAAIGAVIAVVLWHVIRSRTITHEKYSVRRSY